MERACAVLPETGAAGRFAVALRLETRIVATRSEDAVAIKLGAGPGAVEVELTEGEFRRRWPYDHKQMVARIKNGSQKLLLIIPCTQR